MKQHCFVLMMGLFFFFSTSTHAQTSYQTFYVDSISENDTVIYCVGDDSLRFIPPKDLEEEEYVWMLNNYDDTIKQDTLIIWNGYNASVRLQSQTNNKYFYVSPFLIDSKADNMTITCGSSVKLKVSAIYGTPEITSYAWTPDSCLDNPNIANPIATLATDTKFTVTAITSKGCSAIDSVHIHVNPILLDAGEDLTSTCGETVQLNTTNNYNGTETLIYSWSPKTGLDDPTVANPAATVYADTRYTVNLSTALGCVSTDSIKIHLVPMKVPSICIVTVDSTNKNVIVWEKPSSSEIASFNIFKETDVTDVYNKIGTIPFNEQSIFRDDASFPDIQSNRYRISVLDNCGFETAQSEPHKTMHLTINQGQNNTWNLIWESYEGFTVSTYKIYRGTSPNSLELIGTTPGGSTQYSDFSAPDSGYIYYQVEVISPYSCSVSKESLKSALVTYNSSRSNIATNNPTVIRKLTNDKKFINLYPNPAHESFTILSHNNTVLKGTVEIISTSGKTLKKLSINSNKMTINIKDLKNGIYIVKIISEGKVSLLKLLKYK